MAGTGVDTRTSSGVKALKSALRRARGPVRSAGLATGGPSGGRLPGSGYPTAAAIRSSAQDRSAKNAISRSVAWWGRGSTCRGRWS